MSLIKVTSANGNSLARFPDAHPAAQLLGAPLLNSPAGFKDYAWHAVQLLGIAVVQYKDYDSPQPLLGKSDMHAAALDKILVHWATKTQIRGPSNTPIEHAAAVMEFRASADDQAKTVAQIPFVYPYADNEVATLDHPQPYVQGELDGDDLKLQGALLEVEDARTGEKSLLSLGEFVYKAGPSGIDFLNLMGHCSTPAERKDPILKSTAGMLLATSLGAYLNRGEKLDLELTEVVDKVSQKMHVLNFLERTRDLPEGAKHVRMTRGDHVMLHLGLRAAATKLDEDYDRAALGTFDFSMFPAIDRLLLSPKTPSQRDGALASLRELANQVDVKAPLLIPTAMHRVEEFVTNNSAILEGDPSLASAPVARRVARVIDESRTNEAFQKAQAEVREPTGVKPGDLEISAFKGGVHAKAMSQLMGSHAFGEVARKLDPFVRTRDGVLYFALLFTSVGEAERSDAHQFLASPRPPRINNVFYHGLHSMKGMLGRYLGRVPADRNLPIDDVLDDRLDGFIMPAPAVKLLMTGKLYQLAEWLVTVGLDTIDAAAESRKAVKQPKEGLYDLGTLRRVGDLESRLLEAIGFLEEGQGSVKSAFTLGIRLLEAIPKGYEARGREFFDKFLRLALIEEAGAEYQFMLQAGPDAKLPRKLYPALPTSPSVKYWKRIIESMSSITLFAAWGDSPSEPRVDRSPRKKPKVEAPPRAPRAIAAPASRVQTVKDPIIIKETATTLESEIADPGTGKPFRITWKKPLIAEDMGVGLEDRNWAHFLHIRGGEKFRKPTDTTDMLRRVSREQLMKYSSPPFAERRYL